MSRILVLVILWIGFTAVAGQAGRKFILSFPPDADLDTAGWCRIIFNTYTTAEVSLSYHNTTHEITVEDEPYILDMDCRIRAPPGHSNNAVIVESSTDVTVQVYAASGRRGDAYLAIPSRNVGSEYVIFTPPEPCTNRDISTVFTIAAELDDTQVKVYAPATGGYSLIGTINLNKFDTYTNSSVSPSVDFTGWKVESVAPISVVSGSSCYMVNADCIYVNAGYTFSTSIDQTGYQFIVPKITKESPGNSGAYIRVISFSQSNTIYLPDQSINEVIHSGQFIEHQISPWDEITRVECLERCAVYLFNEVYCSGQREGGFTMQVTPLKDFKDKAQFLTISDTTVEYENYITVISETQNIELDDTTLLGWREIPEWNYFEIALKVDDGSHSLQSSDGGKFAAYVYGHANYGYGFEIVREDLTEPPSTSTAIPTTESPEWPGRIPNYRISLISDWVSTKEMETLCITQYTTQLRQHTVEIVVDINNAIGDAICSQLNMGDLSITSFTANFFSSTNLGNVIVSFILSPEANVMMGGILTCANEVTNYAIPHANWGLPLLDPIPECAEPVFEDGVFYEGQHEWICDYGETNAVPSFQIGLRNIGTTNDNSSLSPECTFRYSLSLDDEALSMRSTLNSFIGNQLCAETNGITAVSHVTSFLTEANSVLIAIDYIMINDDNVSGGEALACYNDITQFLMRYENWGSSLLPPEDDCPSIEFDGEEFASSSSKWICNL